MRRSGAAVVWPTVRTRATTRSSTPKKMVRLAVRSALSDRAAEGKVIVVDDWGIDGAEARRRA